MIRYLAPLAIALLRATPALAALDLRHIGFHTLAGLEKRQFRICDPVDIPSCALSCGAGYKTWIEWPNCYNPGEGQTCCSDGSRSKKNRTAIGLKNG